MANLRRRVVAIHAKLETTEGQDPTVAAEDVLVAQDLEVAAMEADLIQSEDARPYMGGRAQVPVNLRRSWTFGIIHGLTSAAAGVAPAYGKLLEACGMSETIVTDTSVTYAPITDNIKSIWGECVKDGQKFTMPGSRGTWDLVITPGQFFRFNFQFLGAYQDPATAAAAAEDRSAWPLVKPVTPLNTTAFSLFGSDYALTNMTMAFAGEVNQIQAVGAAGGENFDITDRSQTGGEITIKAVPKSVVNWEQLARQETTGLLTVTHGSGAGNVITVEAKEVQLTSVGEGDLNGITTQILGYRCLPTVGNDDVSIIHT